MLNQPIIILGKEIDIKIKGLSSLPTVKSVLEKIQIGKKLTLSDQLIKYGLDEYNEFIESNIFKKDNNKEELLKTWLSNRTKYFIEETRKLNKELSKIKFSVIIGNIWFKEFESINENTMVLNIDNNELNCSVDLNEIEVKI